MVHTLHALFNISGTLPQNSVLLPVFFQVSAKVLYFSDKFFLPQLTFPALSAIWTQWYPYQGWYPQRLQGQAGAELREEGCRTVQRRPLEDLLTKGLLLSGVLTQWLFSRETETMILCVKTLGFSKHCSATNNFPWSPALAEGPPVGGCACHPQRPACQGLCCHCLVQSLTWPVGCKLLEVKG